MDIPKHLIDQINQGNVVLFLGAGASLGAMHPKNKSLPSGQKLSDNIALKFLDESYKGKSLQYVSELAISESDLYSVQKYIHDEFIDFAPGDHHKLISTFKWSAIVTTNYDLIIENVFNPIQRPLQSLVTFKRNGERIEEKLAIENSLIYYKLHGCISLIDDTSLPLILTPDQYVTHKENRSRLFERVKDLSYEHPFLFVGYSLADHDIRSMLNHLERAENIRPQSYMVGPNVTAVEERMLAKKNMTSLKMGFEEFINKVDKSSDRALRKVAILRKADTELPIYQKFHLVSDSIKPSESLLEFLQNDVTHVHKNLTTERTSPQDFYKGYFQNWSPIINDYDVERKIKDNILSEVFIQDDEKRQSIQDFYVIKGHAGSGKTVLSKRIAWEASVEFDKLCIYLKPDVPLRYEPIQELYTLCKERIFLFVETCSEYIDDLRYIIKKANKAKIQLTIITTERINTWNTECTEIFDFLSQDYTLGYLDDQEIVRLIQKLEQHNSLGYLKDKSNGERISALAEIHGRELLVALHEATMGKPFEDIVYNEYLSIKNKDAQSLYLTICILHRLGAQTRAGLISRTHNISFTEFERALFLPLESIVFTRQNHWINDFIYLTRHQHIAEIVFERALTDTQSRYDEYIRIISCLDIDYDSDRHAFASMTNARKLMEIFKNPDLIRSIYTVACTRSLENPNLLQQQAILEMQSLGGNFESAEKLLNQAHELAPKDPVIAHSLAELYYRKGERATQKIIRNKYLDEAKRICLQIIKKASDGAHAYHTLIKINLLELSSTIEDFDSEVIERHIKNTEKLLNEAKVSFPNQSFLFEIESKFNELLEDNPKALNSLVKAFEFNKRSTFITLRLVGFYIKRGESPAAIEILKQAIEVNQNDKDLNLRYALLLSENNDTDLIEIKHYLRKSFTQGDTRFEAQFWYARCLYILNEIPNAKIIFETLKDAKVNIAFRKEPRAEITEQNKPKVFIGIITSIESSYGFIKRDETSDSLFFYRHKENAIVWEKLKKYQRVRYKIKFNYRGAVATDIILID